MTAFLETWTARLTREAEGLELFDSHDRISYRVRVYDALSNTKVDTKRALCREMKISRSATRTHVSLNRAIAEYMIIKLCNP